MANEFAYCREKAAPEGSGLYYAMLFEADDMKQHILPPFALHHEVSGCLTASTDPGVVRLKLNWWREELDRLDNGTSRHPVTLSLQSGLDRNHDDISRLRQYLSAIESVVSGQLATLSMEEWYRHLATGFGQLWVIAARTPAPANDRNPTLTCANGGTIFILELLQNSLPLLSRGYRLFPDTVLAQHGISADDPVSRPGHQSVLSLFRMLIEQITERLDADYPLLKLNRMPGSWYELILNRLAHTTCIEIRNDGYQLLQHRVALTPIRKLWIAARTRYWR